MSYFAFLFRLSTGEEKLLIPYFSYETFHKILKTNNTFALQFAKWRNFRTIFGLELETHPEYVKYKLSLKSEIDNSNVEYILKKLIKTYI